MEQWLLKLPPEMWLISASQMVLKSGRQQNKGICKYPNNAILYYGTE